MAKRPNTTSAKKPEVKPKNTAAAFSLLSSTNTTAAFLVVILAAFLLFTYTEKVLDPTLLPKFVGWAVWLLGVMIFLLFYQQKEIAALFKAKTFFSVYALFLLITAGGLLPARLWGDAWLQWSKPFLGFEMVLLLILWFEKDSHYLTLFSRILSLFGLLGGIVGAMQLTKLADFSHENLYTVDSLFAHKNIFCEILLVCLPFAIYQMWQEKGVFRVLGVISVFVSLSMMMMLLSRAVWVAGSISFVLGLICYLIIEKKHQGLSKNNARNLLLGLLLTLVFIIGSAVAYTKFTDSDVIKKQFGALIDVQHIANQGRLHVWEHSVRIWEKNPLWGVGLENWKIELLNFPTKGTESEDGSTTFQRPHNDYLWILSETGIFALAAHLLLFGICYYYLFQHLLSSSHLPSRLFNYATLIALTSYLIFATFAFPKERIEETWLLHLLFFFCCLLPVQAQATAPNVLYKKGNWVLGAVLLPITLYTLYLGYDRLDAERHLRDYDDIKEKIDLATVIEEKINLYKNSLPVLEKAERSNYQLDPMSTSLAFYKGTAQLQLGQLYEAKLRQETQSKKLPFPQTVPDDIKNYYLLAQKELERANKITPHHVQTSNNLGSVYFLLGRKDDAVALYSDAVRICPRYADPAMSLAYLHFMARKYDSAYYTMEAIDTTCSNPKYPVQLRIITDSLFQRAVRGVEEPALFAKSIEILKDKNWTKAVHQKVKTEHLSFRKALLKEAIFWIRKDEKIDDTEKQRLEAKYLQLSVNS